MRGDTCRGVVEFPILTTTHWEDRAWLQAVFPARTVEQGVRWIDASRVINDREETSR